jgi:hypothetical protein
MQARAILAQQQGASIPLANGMSGNHCTSASADSSATICSMNHSSAMCRQHEQDQLKKHLVEKF